MCGIAGFYDRRQQVDAPEEVLRRMVAVLGHRGPDAQGTYIEGGTALGHARLSIIDLDTGDQPMSNEDGSVLVTFNGEIFNYVELREALIARGHAFHTHSDTETIVHQYEEDGPDCVQAFNGDFAYAVWDRRRNRLTLARDRMGVRPLYYTFVGGALVFASEIKALFEVPGVEAEIDPLALDQTFTFWFPLAPRTPFRNIHELPPGHLLVAGDSGVTVKPYWQLSYLSREEDRAAEGRDEEEIAEELRALLIDSTRIRLRADVPVGAYLSGGFDSSLTTALIRQFSSNRLRTFSVGFESTEFDETAYHREMVRALVTDHSSVVCGGEVSAAS
ncbi:MAG: asparagine synthase (glutamine-hydrolyzing) [Armatimonadetes bacterium]|nr:asparagine synthase (glutamine-hydrolyzing) [Armatimonadota bacterium]